jgi:hypothetical protein
MKEKTSLIPVEHVQNSILLIRGQKVILDADLAQLYGTTTKRLNEQVRRNPDRFPGDFMYKLSGDEFTKLKKKFEARGMSGHWGKKRYPPYAFTEHGAIMAAGLINTEIAIEVSIYVVRAFVRLRQIFQTHEDLACKLDALEKKYDAQFSAVFEVIRQLMAPPKPKKKQVGFHWDKKKPAAKKKIPG